jgi:hypothetical protein
MTDLLDTLLEARPYVLAQSGAAIAHTGTTSETTLVTVTLPAAVMGVNGSVEIEALWSLTGSSNKTARMKFGGTSFQTLTATTSASVIQRTRITNRNSASSQVGSPAATTTIYGATSTAVTTASVNTASNVSIIITAQLADGGETMTLESYQIVVSPRD